MQIISQLVAKENPLWGLWTLAVIVLTHSL